MNSKVIKKFASITLIFFGISSVILVLLFYRVTKNYGSVSVGVSQKSTKAPQLSGWVAWWAEKPAYDLIERNPGKIKSVSPVWYRLNADLNLEEIGSVDKKETVSSLKAKNVLVLPSLGSELSEDKLTPFLKDPAKVNALVDQISESLVEIGADGLDVDIEGINKEDKAAFTLFLYKLKTRLKKDNLYFSVTIHAQTKKVVWDGVLGQDLKWIGKNADEVRIMTYDQHSGSSGPGPVASHAWIRDVLRYNFKFMDRDKIVMGIPSYGYAWTDETSKGLQFNEFNQYLEGKEYTQSRDKNSGEIKYISNDFEGWLSDSQAISTKIKVGQLLGVNRFVIWHLGGMDEKVFDKY